MQFIPPDVVILLFRRWSVCAFLGVTQPICGAGAQYGQLGLCAALPPSWMLLQASGCTASDVTSSSHPSIRISGGQKIHDVTTSTSPWIYSSNMKVVFIVSIDDGESK